jgi:hypothetical protein
MRQDRSGDALGYQQTHLQLGKIRQEPVLAFAW